MFRVLQTEAKSIHNHKITFLIDVFAVIVFVSYKARIMSIKYIDRKYKTPLSVTFIGITMLFIQIQGAQ